MDTHFINCEFKYIIERYPEENNSDEMIDIELEVIGEVRYTPGQFYGPPENCYPDSIDSEICSVIGPDGKDWESKLTSGEKSKITYLIEDHINDY